MVAAAPGPVWTEPMSRQMRRRKGERGEAFFQNCAKHCMVFSYWKFPENILGYLEEPQGLGRNHLLPSGNNGWELTRLEWLKHCLSHLHFLTNFCSFIFLMLCFVSFVFMILPSSSDCQVLGEYKGERFHLLWSWQYAGGIDQDMQWSPTGYRSRWHGETMRYYWGAFWQCWRQQEYSWQTSLKVENKRKKFKGARRTMYIIWNLITWLLWGFS